MNFIVIADPNALADKLNAVKKYISDITKVAEVSSPEDNGMRSSIVCVFFLNQLNFFRSQTSKHWTQNPFHAELLSWGNFLQETNGSI